MPVTRHRQERQCLAAVPRLETGRAFAPEGQLKAPLLLKLDYCRMRAHPKLPRRRRTL